MRRSNFTNSWLEIVPGFNLTYFANFSMYTMRGKNSNYIFGGNIYEYWCEVHM